MAKQKLTGNSCLLTAHGWRKLQDRSSGGSSIGVDRSGKLTEEYVEVSPIGDLDKVAFLGSSGAFGQFHPESRLIDSDGVSRSASEIIEKNLVGECRFENATYVDGGIASADIINDLWMELKRSAIIRGDNQIILPARGLIATDTSSHFEVLEDEEDWATTEVRPRYVCIEESKFKEILLKFWPDAILELIGILFEKTEDRIILFDRTNYIWCLWFLFLSGGQDGVAGELGYDSLQHTTRIWLTVDAANSSSGFSKGGTAFFKNQLDTAYEAYWENPSWSPISSGFILTSS